MGGSIKIQEQTSKQLLSENAKVSKKLERANVELENLASFVEHNPSPILQTRYDGTIISANPAAEKIFGKRVRSKSLFKILPNLKKSHINKITKSKLLQVEHPVKKNIIVFSIKKDTKTRSLYIYGTDITDYGSTKEALIKSQEKFKSAFDNSAVGMALTDIMGNLLEVNRAMSDILGYTEKELHSMTIKDVTYPGDVDENSKMMRELWNGTKKGFSAEKRYIHKNGQEVQGIISVSPVYDADGKTIYALGQLQDITESKRVEKRLVESENRFRMVIEQASDAMFLVNLDGTFVDVNQLACDERGYTRNELLKLSIPEISPVFTAENLSRFIKELKPGNPVTVESIHQKKDGTTFPVEIRAGLIDISGEKFLLSHVRDITKRKRLERELTGHQEFLEELVEERTKELWETNEKLKEDIIERKQAEEALAESEEKYRNLVENSNAGIYILRDNRFVYVNETFEKITGYNFEEVSSGIFNFMDLVAPESKDFILKRSISREKDEKSDVNYVFKCITKSGNIIDLEANISAIEYGGKPGLQGIVKDVTSQMRDKKENLELQEKLVQSQRMESLGLLAGGVAHDLNNIIGPILAYPDLIRMDYAKGKPIDKDLDTIEISAKRAADVITDLLALTRRGQYKMEPIDLNDLVNEYLSSAEYKATKRFHSEVAPLIQLSKERLFFKGSQAHLPKIVMNLVNNAFESMPEGGVLSISTSSINVRDGELSNESLPEGRYNLLTIEDQGEGIPEENITKIFDPFFTTKIKTGKSGTGLGLSVVYNVLKDNGAHVNVESKLGRGTKFFIYFPETTEMKKTIQKDKQIQRGSGTILVVDDRKEQRVIATRLLTKLGYEVECVDKGQDAIKYLRKNDVNIVLLDMILEDDMDGLDTYKEIIKIKPSQKTIIMSGYSESDRIKEAERLGVNCFIHKPYNIDEIGLAIREVLLGNISSK